MARKHKAQAKALARHGRYGDTQLAHLSADEIAILDSLQGGSSINPVTGLSEYFSLKKVLKGVAKAAGALVGGYVAGPAGAAIGGGITSALLGDSTKKALTTGLLSGLGAWGVQQTGIGDSLGISALGSNADLLGRTAAEGAAGAAGKSLLGGGGGGMSSLLPLLGLGAAAVGAGSYKPPKPAKVDAPEEIDPVEYEDLDRNQLAYAQDPYSYGIFGPEQQYFDEVNPQAVVKARKGGAVRRFAIGGTAESGDFEGRSRASGGFGNESGRSGTGGGSRGGGDTNRDRLEGNVSPIGADRAAFGGTGGWFGDSKSASDWSKAWDSYQKRGFGWDVLDTLAGPLIDVEPPMPTNRPSYVGGDWHTNTNLGGVVGALGGLFGGLPVGGAYIGSTINDFLGVPNLYHGDWSFGNTPSRFSGMFDGTGATGQTGAANQGFDRDNQNAAGTHHVPDPARTAPTAGTPTTPGTPTTTTPSEEDDGTDPWSRTYIPLSAYLNYGQATPEHLFYDQVNMQRGGGVTGPGHGQSDDIPAMLSDGEYVWSAQDVADLGGGSNAAGVRMLDQMRQKVRKNAGRKNTKKIAPTPKGLSHYLRSAA